MLGLCPGRAAAGRACTGLTLDKIDHLINIYRVEDAVTRTITRVIPKIDPESRLDPVRSQKSMLTLGIPQRLRSNPNKFSAYRPRSSSFTPASAKKNGATGRMTALAKLSSYSAGS